MASLSRLIKEKGGEPGGIRTGQVKVQQIHYTKLRESGLNFYTRSGEEVEELADSMLIAGGILQPLIVRKTDLSEYEILAGHKRKRASIYNVERGYKEYEFLPCIVVDMGGLMAEKISEKILAGQGDAGDDRLLDMIAEYIVICTNSTSSESSNYEKMMQAARLSEILPAMLENGELKGRALRAEIAREMKCGDGQVGRYQSIYNNLVPEAMERFKDGRITISVAYGLSGLDSDRQQLALKKQQVTMADIDFLKQEKSRETVSDSDTGKVYGTEFQGQEGGRETVSDSDTGKAPPETSHTCTENNPGTPDKDEKQDVTSNNGGSSQETDPVAVVDGDTKETAAGGESGKIQETDYTPEDVRKLYDEQTGIVRQFEYAMECGGMREAEKWTYKRALMIRDGMKRLLKERHTVPVPCSTGDILYSIIGEKVNSYRITGFRIDGEKTYMESEESMLFAADKIGTYYFFSQELAEREFRKWSGKSIEKHHA